MLKLQNWNWTKYTNTCTSIFTTTSCIGQNFQHESWKFASRFVKNWHLSYYVKLSSDSDISKDCWNWTSTFDNQLTKTYFGSTHKAQELLFSVIIPQVHTFPIVSWVDLWQYQQASYISIWLYICMFVLANWNIFQVIQLKKIQ